MGWTSQYVLENENGERIDLTAPNSVFLVAVEGLGIVTERRLGSIGNGFFLITSDEVPANPITGDLIYRDGAFDSYESLVNWIAKAQTLYFCYAPLDAEYRCRVRLNYINKAARDSAGYMRAAVSFHPLTPWYLPVNDEIAIETGGPDSKAYLEHSGSYYYEYNDNLVYGPELSGDLRKLILPAGHEPTGFLLRYTGAIKNPVITLVGQTTGKVYGECHIAETLGSTETLVLCTAPDNSYVQRITGGLATNLMATSQVDLAYDPYPRAPVDEASILTITGDEAISGTAELILYRYYRSV